MQLLLESARTPKNHQVPCKILSIYFALKRIWKVNKGASHPKPFDSQATGKEAFLEKAKRTDF